MATIKLCFIPEMDSSMQNVPFFNGGTEQANWFEQIKHVKKVLEANISVDGNRFSVTVDVPYDEIVRQGINYLITYDTYGKRMFYFVVDYDYKTSNATTLLLQFDSFQTYIYNVAFLDTFVDRCHVDRYRTVEHVGSFPNGGTLDEGLEMGDMILSDLISAKFRDKYIIASTTPLGKNGWNRPSSGGGGGIQPLPTDRERMDAWRTICRGV